MTKLFLFYCRYSSVLLVLWLLQSCSKDKGNYDYKEVNRITIGNVLQAEHYTGRIYPVDYNDSLIIEPTVTGSISGTDLSQLRFAWVVEGDTVSREKDLHLLATMGYGSKVSNFYITDLTTGQTITYNFIVNISNPMSRGHFVLCETEDGRAALFMKSLDPAKRAFIVQDSVGPYAFGRKPIGMSINKQYGSSSTDYNFYLTLSCQESENPLIQVYLTDFIPSFLVQGTSFVEPIHPFEPSDVKFSLSDKGKSYIVNNGKLYVVVDAVGSQPLYQQDPLDYRIGDGAALVQMHFLEGYYTAFFDQKNQRIRLLSTNWGAEDNFVKNFDNLIDPDATKGHTFVAGAEANPSSSFLLFLTKKGNQLFLHQFEFDDNYEPTQFSTISTTRPDLDKLSKAVYHDGAGFWYIAIGRTIYRSSYQGLDLQEYIKLPADGSGDIATFNFNSDVASSFLKIGIATYNPTGAEPHKGSYYEYDIATEKITGSYLNSLDKPVAIEIGM